MLRRFSPITWFILLLLAAATLALTLPPAPATLHALHITTAVYRAAILTLILPYGVIWFAAFYAFDMLAKYASKIKSAREGEAFCRIARGIGIMAWGMALTTITALICNSIAARFHGFDRAHTIINNYIALLVPIVAFITISTGTYRLTAIARAKPGRIGSQILTFIYIVVAVFFMYFVMHNHVRNNPYRLPLVPLITTLIIPYIYAWFIGLLSAYELWLYAHKATGVLYRHALTRLATGLTIVIAAAIAVQYDANTYASKTNISLSTTLCIMYALLAAQASGYVLIALGAKRLKMIEEV
ncbi:MAG TPA: hypothetical protein VFT53_01605 [Candidatus Saccharimonadales bacterium]|nr:hypothetical protein [Candidatus Saccharimonadales bacterium]